MNNEKLLKQSDPKQKGIFYIEKCVFLDKNKNINAFDSQRCDYLSYTGVLVSEGTEYQSHSISPVAKSAVSNGTMEVKRVVNYQHIIDASPNFYISYLEYDQWADIQPDPTPSTMWVGKSIFQLFKTMREWSFLADDPFNSDHPMATYSKLAFDTFNPSQSILEELDALPDMHLAKFFKGEADYKMIPYPYPEVSQQMKTWVLGLAEQYKQKTFEQMLDAD